MSDRVQPPAATLDDGSDPPARRRPHPPPPPQLPDSRSSQVLCEFPKLASPSLDVAFTRPQLGWQAGKARLDNKQTCTLGVRLERELDERHRCIAREVCLPAKGEAPGWLERLDHTAAGAPWASRTVPAKDNVPARTQIDAGLRTEPGTELVRLRQRRPDPRWRYGQDDLSFD